MAKSDVKEMVTLCRGLGLRVQVETGSGHYTVRDPGTLAKLFYISTTPSDSNFKYEIARYLRKLGLLKGNLKYGKFKPIIKTKKFGSIDLVALKKAQAAAESAGERIPLLEDIDGQTEFFRRTADKAPMGYVDEAQQEAIDNMAVRLSPIGNSTKQRLRKFYKEHPGYKDSEFVRTAIEVGNDRGLRVWPTINAGQAAIGQFKNDDDKTLQIWGINLVQATLDHLEGLQWGKVDETISRINDEVEEERRVSTPMDSSTANDLAAARAIERGSQFITETDLGNILENFKVQIINEMQTHLQERVNDEVNSIVVGNGSDELRTRYADTLLTLLASNPAMELDSVMQRLDKLVGLD